MVAHVHRKITEIGRKADLDSFGAKCETDRIDGVMRNRERLYLDIADLEAMPRFELFQFLELRPLAVLVSKRARPGSMRGRSEEDGHAQLFRQRRQAIHMVRMLVGDENRGDGVRIFAQRPQALEDLAAGDSGIDQNSGARAGDKSAISLAAAGQHGNAHTHLSQHTRPRCESGSYFSVSLSDGCKVVEVSRALNIQFDISS